ncbi:hypothetical protein MRB53_028480 [Persea americana]|uniref:Uncharacterized protein n=1 Tax=Persea americana TaxID=3435 RepID=A0ACC2KFT9_PERAE|nr:hypothetical protein MRB53_028480 [Persea americana]
MTTKHYRQEAVVGRLLRSSSAKMGRRRWRFSPIPILGKIWHGAHLDQGRSFSKFDHNSSDFLVQAIPGFSSANQPN